MSGAPGRLLFENGEGPDGRAAAALYEKRHPVESELALADQLLQVDQPLPVEDAPVPTHPVAREEVVARQICGGTLDAVGPRTAVGEPVGRLGGQTRVAPYYLGVRVVTLV